VCVLTYREGIAFSDAYALPLGPNLVFGVGNLGAERHSKKARPTPASSEWDGRVAGALSSWMWQNASRATAEHKITTLSRMHHDAISVLLISVAACLVLAILILSSTQAAQLTPDQINMLPLWGP
jgi:hypothetical protein